MKIKTFLTKYNANLPAHLPKASLQTLHAFKKENRKLFHGKEWEMEYHRRPLMDWLPKNRNIIRNLPYFAFGSVIAIDDDFFKDGFLHVDKAGAPPIIAFTKHQEHIYSVHLGRRHYFNAETLYYDFANLPLVNYFGPKGSFTRLSDDAISGIIAFVNKYGTDFIPYEKSNGISGIPYNEGALGDGSFSYFSQFSYVWSQFVTFQELLKADSTIPYSKSIKRYEGTALIVKDFQKTIVDRFLSKRNLTLKTKSKEDLKNIYLHFSTPISLLFEKLVDEWSARQLKRCAYCEKHFVAIRRDSTGCGPQHNSLIRAKRLRQKTKRLTNKGKNHTQK